MRFIVVGAGAIGGVIGGRLFEAGYDVALVARGAHLAAMRADGLVVESPDRTVTPMIPAYGDPGELAPDDGDVIVLAVKSQDTLAALDAVAASRPPSTPIVCAQNGVENERVALRRFAHVYGMCVMCPATHLVPGVVQANSAPVSGLMDVGRWPGGIDDVASAVADAFSASTFSSIARDDIARWKWSKLLMNLGNAVEAICGHDAEGVGALAGRAREEGVACLRAAGIDFIPRDDDQARRGGLLTARPIAGAPRGGGSTWQSMTRQTGSIETDYLTGEIVLVGRLCGFETPLNALLQRLAAQMASERTQPGWLSVDEVLALV